MNKEKDKQKLYKAAQTGDVRHSFHWFVRWRFPLLGKVGYYTFALKLDGKVVETYRDRDVQIVAKFRKWHPVTWMLIVFAIGLSFFVDQSALALIRELLEEHTTAESVHNSILSNAQVCDASKQKEDYDN